MLYRRIVYIILFIFFMWLALATRHHAEWFHPFVAKYAGDTIWAGMFLFILRIIFSKTNLIKLAIWNYLFGVLDEASQLWHTSWLNAIRSTTIGRLMLGTGFVWSDLICYAVGTILAYCVILLLERLDTCCHDNRNLNGVRAALSRRSATADDTESNSRIKNRR